jgi:two-component system nitrate/nitrite response regulator NarL
MSGVTPLVVTHPCALVRDGLREILSKSTFRPTHILPALDEDTESLLASSGVCIWLVGVNECGTTTNDLVSRVVSKNPDVRAVILTGAHTASDILPAFVAGACGFLRQDIPSKQLVKSLELVALGQSVMHPHFQQMAATSPAGPAPANGEGDASSASSIELFPRRSPQSAYGMPASGQPGDDVVRSLSRRELVILRTLTEGASNKIIARKLVITESTVKVQMRAIMPKLRLQYRPQRAIWARTYLGEMLGHAA